MATGNSAKKSCCKCNKGGGTLTCDGCEILKRDFSQQNHNQMLLAKIDRWEKESIAKIQGSARTARVDLRRLTEGSKNRLSNLMNKLSNEFRVSRENDEYIEDDLDRWTKQLEEFRKEFEKLSTIELSDDASSSLRSIKIKNPDEKRINKSDSHSPIVDDLEEASREPVTPDILLSPIESPHLHSQSIAYPCVSVGLLACE